MHSFKIYIDLTIYICLSNQSYIHLFHNRLFISNHHSHTNHHACHNSSWQFHSPQVSSEVKGKRLAAHVNCEVPCLTVAVEKKADW